MNDTQIAWWLDRLGSFTLVIDRLNKFSDPVYLEACEQIRGIVNNAMAHGRSADETQELPAVDLGEAS